jgi:citrate lyase subunit beta/citryl-CoA lyase
MTTATPAARPTLDAIGTRPTRIRRSRILVPASSTRYLEKARSLEADVILLDLEDAVPATEEDKRQGRDTVVKVLKEGGFKAREITVRVNDATSRWILDDIPAVLEAGADSISIPHARGLADVLMVEGIVESVVGNKDVPILLQVETPLAFHQLRDIAQWSKRMSAVSMGGADFSLEMGSRVFNRGANRTTDNTLWARMQLLHIGRAHGWNVTDSVTSGGNPNDLEAVREAMLRSRDYGFDGASTLYPAHVAVANEVFGVSEDDLKWAAEVIEAYSKREPGKAVTNSLGYLILPAAYESACRLMEMHKVLNGE